MALIRPQARDVKAPGRVHNLTVRAAISNLALLMDDTANSLTTETVLIGK